MDFFIFANNKTNTCRLVNAQGREASRALVDSSCGYLDMAAMAAVV